jgi:hypothetical protein
MGCVDVVVHLWEEGPLLVVFEIWVSVCHVAVDALELSLVGRKTCSSVVLTPNHNLESKHESRSNGQEDGTDGVTSDIQWC